MIFITMIHTICLPVKRVSAENYCRSVLSAGILHVGVLLGYLILQMEPICPSETSVDSEWTTRSYMPEDSNLHKHSCDNLLPTCCRWLTSASKVSVNFLGRQVWMQARRGQASMEVWQQLMKSGPRGLDLIFVYLTTLSVTRSTLQKWPSHLHTSGNVINLTAICEPTD
jgi:hypothetical protein